MPSPSLFEKTPDYAMMSLDNLFVILWRKNTTLEGIAKLVKHLAAEAAKNPKGMGLVTIVPTTAVPPPNEVRGKLASALSEAVFVKGSAVCFEGTGLRATIVRSVVTGLTLLSPPPFPHKVFGTLESGVEFVNQNLEKAGAPTSTTSRVVKDIEAWRQSL